MEHSCSEKEKYKKNYLTSIRDDNVGVSKLDFSISKSKIFN